MELTPEKLDEILDEIAGFEIHLVEDPTLPQYGTRYLQKCVSDCRNFTNRVQHYLQVCKKAEKIIRRSISITETDIDLKMKDLLSEDPNVRREPSFGDRQARAVSMLRPEHEELNTLKTNLLDLDETIKIIKMKYNDLKSTNSDIKLQRQIIKDELTDNPGGDGHGSPGRAIGSGMGPAVTKDPIDPVDLLDDKKRPEDMPKPRDAAHARQIAGFYNSNISKTVEVKKEESFETPNVEPEEPLEEKIKVSGGMSYEELLS